MSSRLTHNSPSLQSLFNSCPIHRRHQTSKSSPHNGVLSDRTFLRLDPLRPRTTSSIQLERPHPIP
jgi:hypothetical protein